MHIRARCTQYWNVWLNKRIPPKNNHALTMRSVFILPSRFGCGFIIITVCLFLLGTNYQNNLILFLCYMLSAILLLTLFYSYKNFAAITIYAHQPTPIFAGETGKLALQLGSQTSVPISGVLYAYWQYNKSQTVSVDIHRTHGLFNMPYHFVQRGEYRLPRMTLTSAYPFGLFHCWTHLDFAIKALVYPKPEDGKIPALETQSSALTEHKLGGNEDFYTLKDFSPGESLNRIAWKQVAKHGRWVIKQFSEPRHHAVCLTLPQHYEVEKALSVLTHHILSLHQQNKTYGLKIGHIFYSPNSGQAHLVQCLSALARYPQEKAHDTE